MSNTFILLEFGNNRKIRESVMVKAIEDGKYYLISNGNDIRLERVSLCHDSGRILDVKGNPVKFQIDGMDLYSFRKVE